MKDSDIVAPVVAYYEAKLRTFGPTARGVDWKDERSQRIRFAQLVRALGLDRRSEPFSIVDFGCGYGALLPFLAARGLSFTYTGYDRSSAMIEAAQREHGAVAGAKFTTGWDSVESADFVVASGVFNVRMNVAEDQWIGYTTAILAKLHEKARLAWAVNFLTSYSDEDRKREDLHYADPAAVLAWCQLHASRWVSVLHDYELYEFTIGVRRRPE